MGCISYNLDGNLARFVPKQILVKYSTLIIKNQTYDQGVSFE